jgi:molybdate transport system substrate-binding protein
MAILKVLSTRAVQVAVPELLAGFGRATGTPVAVDYGPTNAMLTRIKGGERADIAILSREGVDELAQAGILDAGSTADLVRSVVGLAVKAGAPKPDISSAEALKATLLAARSVCYSRLGQSGVFFGNLIGQLGIADEVNAKATIIPSGLTGELAARGEVEMAIQQVSELRAVQGIDIVGPLPATLQTPTVFAAAAFAGSAQAEAARAFIEALTSAEAARAFKGTGLDPVRA